MEDGFTRHIRACNNVTLPGEYEELWLHAEQVGWVRPRIARALAAALPDAVLAGHRIVVTDMAAAGRALAEAKLVRRRGEELDVRTEVGGPVLGRVDRGALPALGLLAEGVHLNALVRRAEGLHLWVARRAADKALDPGKLDHLVAGGVPAGLGAWDCLVKEAQEEAGLPERLLRDALAVEPVRYAMERPEGLRRDHLHCFDLELPEGFEPQAMDGEVAGFELWPIERVVNTVRATDAFKFNVNLVLIGLFERLGLVGT
ncbi:MAG: NUDIX domain-containing protein [Rhodospirillales bacterium]|nr:NUDIX domain-containing protein [Rhodospirillales bacterium]